MTDYISWFKELNKDSIGVAGGKGANLAEMTNIGLPVPPGFVVTAQTYEEFIEKTAVKARIFKLLEGLDIEKTEELQQVAKQIQELIKGTDVPENIKEAIIEAYDSLGVEKGTTSEMMEKRGEVFVAVRSSATAEDLPEASFAGQQATFLNVKGDEDVFTAVRACWASLFTARAIYYREKNNFSHKKVLIAAIVQKMVNSEKSGVMFTINPSNNHPDEIVIEAVYGLGEAIVSGEVSPDFYLVNKSDRSIKKIEVRKKKWGLYRDEEGKNEKVDIPKEKQERQILDNKEIMEIARLGKKIEEHYGKPQDIEWAIEKGEIMIVQSRAVTTFKPVEKEEGEKVEDEKSTPQPSSEAGKILVKGETASGGVYSGKVRLIRDASELSKIEKGDVLVTTMTTPDMVPAMQKAGAIVTNEGGMTCHAAIVSREMGTPCIVGTEHATEVLKDRMMVTVHADRGIVYEGKIEVEKVAKKVVVAAGEPIITATEIKLIMDLPNRAAEAAEKHKVDGIGLVRVEFIIAEGGVHPAEYIREGKDGEYTELLVKGLRKIAQAFKGKPVWVRNSDMRTDEYRNLKGGEQEPHESDPMIGWHAIRRLLDEPRLMKAECLAIKKLHEEGLTNIGIMLPFVINVSEVREAKEIMREVGLEPCENVDFGVMIETPASCWIIEDLCKEGIDFVSFGTNDLTQTTLGIDRNNERIAPLFDEMHPAVLGEMAKVIKTCQKFDVKSSICGQAGSRPEMAEFLVHQGIDSISVNVDAVDEIRRTVAKTEKKLLLDAGREEIEEREERGEGMEEE
ncbi:phosphoenolpyruvate synthase [Candidatus Woesearchaeota archaeon]|nr:phosphoenolpyruvate synthase [Candidatus Woesearchaeota archaeon]